MKNEINNPLNKQIGGSHYKNFKIQPIEFIQKNNLSFIQGCIIKYICRYKDKNGLQDLEKIKHYVDLLIELEYNNESNIQQTDTCERLLRNESVWTNICQEGV